MADCVWHLEAVNSLGFFKRGEKGKSIQTAVWILKTSAADAKDTQKGFTSVALCRGGGDCFAFRKREFFLFLKKTFSLGCTEEKSLWVLNSNSGSFLEASWCRCLSYGLSQEAKMKFCVCPAASSCCVSGGESHPHIWFPLSQGSTQRSPQGKPTDRKLQGRRPAAQRPSKELNALYESELIHPFFWK